MKCSIALGVNLRSKIYVSMMGQKVIIICVAISVLAVIFFFGQKLIMIDSRDCVSGIIYSIKISVDGNEQKIMTLTDTSVMGMIPEKKQFDFATLEPVVLGGDVKRWNLRVLRGAVLNFEPMANSFCVSPTVEDALKDTKREVDIIVNGKKYLSEPKGITAQYAGEEVTSLKFELSSEGLYQSIEQVDIYWVETL